MISVVTNEVLRDDIVFVVAMEALKGTTLRGSLHGGLNVVVGAGLAKTDSQVNNGDIGSEGFLIASHFTSTFYISVCFLTVCSKFIKFVRYMFGTLSHFEI